MNRHDSFCIMAKTNQNGQKGKMLADISVRVNDMLFAR